MTRRYLRRCSPPTCAAGALVRRRPRPAEDQEATLINWWYSATFGTGFYKIGPAVATVVRLPFSYRCSRWKAHRRRQPARPGHRRGVSPHSRVNQFNLHEDVAAASVLPGAEVEIR